MPAAGWYDPFWFGPEDGHPANVWSDSFINHIPTWMSTGRFDDTGTVGGSQDYFGGLIQLGSGSGGPPANDWQNNLPSVVELPTGNPNGPTNPGVPNPPTTTTPTTPAAPIALTTFTFQPWMAIAAILVLLLLLKRLF